MTALPEPPPSTWAGGRLLDARLALLDRQMLDAHGVQVGVVDDLELSDPPEPVADAAAVGPLDVPAVRHLVHGPVILARLFGGRPPEARLQRVPWSAVGEVGAAVRLVVDADAVGGGWLEAWLRDRVIGRIPGGRHVPR